MFFSLVSLKSLTSFATWPETHDNLGAPIRAFAGAGSCLPLNGTKKTVLLEGAALVPNVDSLVR